VQKKTEGTSSPAPLDSNSKLKSSSQENLNKLRSNPRHSWAFDRNYEESWKSIDSGDKLPAPPTESELAANRNHEGHDTDGSTSDADGASSGESDAEAAKNKNVTKAKVSVLTEGEYRTIKPLRPVQSKTLPRRASTGKNKIIDWGKRGF
jgi:hypothetical protein